jgi:hypothetical protein
MSLFLVILLRKTFEWPILNPTKVEPVHIFLYSRLGTLSTDR